MKAGVGEHERLVWRSEPPLSSSSSLPPLCRMQPGSAAPQRQYEVWYDHPNVCCDSALGSDINYRSTPAPVLVSAGSPSRAGDVVI